MVDQNRFENVKTSNSLNNWYNTWCAIIKKLSKTIKKYVFSKLICLLSNMSTYKINPSCFINKYLKYSRHFCNQKHHTHSLQKAWSHPEATLLLKWEIVFSAIIIVIREDCECKPLSISFDPEQVSVDFGGPIETPSLPDQTIWWTDYTVAESYLLFRNLLVVNSQLD